MSTVHRVIQEMKGYLAQAPHRETAELAFDSPRRIARWAELLASCEPAEPAKGTVSLPVVALNWFFSPDKGASSLTIFAHMLGMGPLHGSHCPHDAEDFGRCVRLLEQVPSWRDRLHEMAYVSPRWAALVSVWPELATLHRAGQTAELSTQVWDIATARGPQGGTSTP